MRIKNILIYITLLVIIFTCVWTNFSYAVDVGSVITELENKDRTVPEEKKFKQIMNNALGVVQVIGIGTAVIMLIAVAIKYMTSAVNEKAEIKKNAVPYVVGAVFIFGAGAIVGIIRQFAFTI